MKIVIYGGSFDPIHNGHLKMALHAKEKLNADKVIFLLSKHPRFKQVKADDKHRLEMLKIALDGISWAEIDLTEYNSSEEVNYTYLTMLKLKEKYQGELYFLIGGDNINLFDKWYEAEKLSNLVSLVGVERPNVIINQDLIDKYQIKLIGPCLSEMSSTSLRNFSMIECPFNVLKYIIEHELYFVPQIRKYISQKRFNHSYEVAKLAYQIAKENNLNPYKAFQGGLLHDIGRELNIDYQRDYMNENYKEYVDQLKPSLYHQFLSVHLAEKQFNIHDQELLESFKYHATGKADLSPLGKVIYVSDKIEPTRGYDSSHMIKACLNDIEKGFVQVLEENIKYLTKTNKDFNNILTNSCIEYYLEGKNESN